MSAKSSIALLFLLIIILLLMIASAPADPYSRQWGYAPSGSLGTILLMLVMLGHIHIQLAGWGSGAISVVKSDMMFRLA